MDEKKKIIVLGTLFAAFIAVGAFSFIPKGQPQEFEGQTEEASAKVPVAEEKKVATLPNPRFAAPLAARDPFQVPESRLLPLEPEQPVRGITPTRPLQELAGNLPLPGTLGVEPVRIDGLALAEQQRPDEDPPFGYSVSGVVVGERPLVVFKDAQGNQRLVGEGAALDGDTRVKAVSLTYVSVSYRGKNLRLTVGD
jgi:hypothetical protein